MRCYVSVIKSVLKDCNIEVDEDQYLISSLTKACRLQNDQVRTQLPLQKGVLGILLKEIDNKWPAQRYLTALYKAIFSTMYYRLLRISEIAGQHPILAQDVHIGENKRKFLLILRTSKTHWKNMKPQMVKILAINLRCKSRSSMTAVKEHCPYTILCEYARLRGSFKTNKDPFFVLSDKTVVSQSQISNCLKTLLKDTGFDCTLYSTHSLRIGRTTDLAKLGLSVETIKKIGRWKSNVVYRYLHD